MKDGIYIQRLIPVDPEDIIDRSFWYIAAVKNNKVLYLHKDGNWREDCYNGREYLGHYKTKEEAIKIFKFYTNIKVINNGEQI